MHALKNRINGFLDPIPEGLLDAFPPDVVFSTSRHGLSKHYIRKESSCKAFIEHVTRHEVGEKEGSAWSPFDYADDNRRAANCIGSDVVALDIDNGTPLDEIEERAEAAGIAVVIVSSFSHMSRRTKFKKNEYDKWRKDHPDADDEDFLRTRGKGYRRSVWRGSIIERGRAGEPSVDGEEEITIGHAPCEKYRIIVPLAESFVVSDYGSYREAASKWESLCRALADTLKLTADQNALDLARLFFDPRHPAGVEPIVRLVGGEPFNAKRALARAREAEGTGRVSEKAHQRAPLARQSRRPKVFGGNLEVLRSALMAIRNDERFADRRGDEGWLKVLGAISYETGHSEEGRDLAHEWSKTFTRDDYDEAATDSAWDSLRDDHPNGATGATLRNFAIRDKWTPPDGFPWGDGGTKSQIVFEDERLGTALATVGSALARADEGDDVRPNAVADLAFTGRGGDLYNGATFASLYRDKLLFIFETGDVLRFDPEGGWLAAAPGTAERAAKAVVGILRDSAETDEARMRHVTRLCDARAQRAMIEMARSEPGMTRRISEFDSDPMLLGVLNGVLDLRTGKLLPISPDLLVSKRCNVAFDPDALCPRFERFMQEVQPDSEVREFLQRFVGYCLTGEVSEQVFAIFHGGGKNGKSVFIEQTAWLLGDYAKKIPTELLMHHQRNPQGASPEIVALKGLRLAFANETEEGRRLAEARVKDLTGGDTLTGRRLYSDDISFRPSHKLVIVGNHKPEIADMSAGMWRRVALTPWGQLIAERDRDPHLLEKLKREGAGILNWALDRSREWQERGLQIPQAVKDATAGYRDDEDIIGEWLGERCEVGKGLYESKATAYADYKEWADENGHKPLAQGRFTKRLTSRGFSVDGGKRNIEGLALSDSSNRGRRRRRF